MTNLNLLLFDMIFVGFNPFLCHIVDSVILKQFEATSTVSISSDVGPGHSILLAFAQFLKMGCVLCILHDFSEVRYFFIRELFSNLCYIRFSFSS